jgi:hypothetical protein
MADRPGIFENGVEFRRRQAGEQRQMRHHGTIDAHKHLPHTTLEPDI